MNPAKNERNSKLFETETVSSKRKRGFFNLRYFPLSVERVCRSAAGASEAAAPV